MKTKDAIDRLSNKVKDCVQRKLVPAKQCFCKYPTDLMKAKEVYHKTVTKYPHWKSTAVNLKRNGQSVVISFFALGIHFQRSC